MTSSRVASVLLSVVLVVPAVFAAEDLTGKWTGAFNTSMDGGAPRDDVAFMVLKQTGAELTGTVGPNAERQWPIVKGKVEAVTVGGKETTKVSFDVKVEEGAGPMLHFDLELVEGHLKGKANAEQDGHTMAATVDVTRAK